MENAHHAQTHALVPVDEVAQVFASGSHRDTLSVAKLVQPALDTKICFPVLTVGRTSSHRPKQVRVDFDDLLHRTRC